MSTTLIAALASGVIFATTALPQELVILAISIAIVASMCPVC